jgi:hypothetical protein
MAHKRPPLEISAITESLKESKGQGVGVFFPSPPTTTIENQEVKPKEKPTVAKSSKEDTSKLIEPYGRTDSPGVRTDVLLKSVPRKPEKRRPERYAFQFWSDQITRLKKLKQVLNINKDPEAREEVSLSDMIREAVDDYIDKQMKQLKQSERTEG